MSVFRSLSLSLSLLVVFVVIVIVAASFARPTATPPPFRPSNLCPASRSVLPAEPSFCFLRTP